MNPKQLEHPDQNLLKAFVVGKVEIADVDAIEQHLASCQPCQQTIQQIQDDTFVSLVREAKNAAVTDGHKADPNAETIAPANSDDPPQANTFDLPHPTTEGVPTSLANHPRFRVLELLGQGGMGAVYKAEHRHMERMVALKIISADFVAKTSAVERFRREVKAAARLDHPNIVHAYDAELDGDVHFLVMEYVDGTDLHQVLKDRGPLPIHESCEFIRQAALGLQHAHEHGMVHRDIKPQNLMLTHQSRDREGAVANALPHGRGSDSGSIKILDFGLASLTTENVTAETFDANSKSKIENQQSSLTQAGTIMGTPDYMAPEQAEDASAADIRADIYSLGCTFYTLLTGNVPFPDGSALDKVVAQIERQPQPVAEIRSEIPSQLVKVLEKMMAKDPAERYQTPAEVAQALDSRAREDDKQDAKRTRTITMPADGLTVAASLALLTAIGALLWWRLAPGALLLQHPADMLLQAFALAHLAYAVFIIAAGQLLRRRRGRIAVLLCITIVGVAVPVLFAANIAFEELALWQLMIPQWLGVPVCIWATVTLFRRDVREAFVESAARSRFGFRDLVATLAIPGGVLLLGGVIWINTDNGRLAIDCKTDDVQVVVSKGGKQYEVIDLQSGTTVKRLPSGEYKITLKGGRTDVKLSKGGFTITRWGKEIVSVTRTAVNPNVPTSKEKLPALVMRFEKEHFYQKGGKTYVRDLSGRGNDGLCEGVEFTPNGKAGGALACKGGYLRLARSLVNRQSNYTFTGWVRVNSPKNEHEAMYFYREAHGANLQHGDYGFYCGYKKSRHIAVGAYLNAWKYVNTPGDVYDFDTWYFVAVRLTQRGKIDEGDLMIRVNDRVFAFQSQPTHIRKDLVGQLGKKLLGTLDEVVFYPRALPDEEIADIRRAGLEGRSLPESVLPTTPAKDAITLVRRFEHHRGAVNGIKFARDGAVAFSASADGTVIRWEVRTGKVLNSWREHDKQVHSLALSPDGRWIASGSVGRIVVRDLLNNQTQVLTDHKSLIGSLAFAGRYLVTACHDGVARQWELESGKVIRKLEFGKGNLVDFVVPTSDGERVLVGGRGRQPARLWNLQTGKVERKFETGSDLWTAAILPGDRQTVTGHTDGTIRLWNLSTGGLTREITGPSSKVSELAVSRDGRYCFATRADKTIHVIELASRRLIAKVAAVSNCVNRLALSPDGHYALSGGGVYWDGNLKLDGDYALRLWQLPKSVWPNTPDPLTILRQKAVRIVKKQHMGSFSPDGNQWAFGQSDGTIDVMDLKTGKTRLLTESGSAPVWSPDGEHIVFEHVPKGQDKRKASLSGRTEIWLVPAAGGNKRRLAQGAFASWHADSKRIYFHRMTDRKIYVIAVDDPAGKAKPHAPCPGFYPAVSPDGSQIAYVLGNEFRIVNAATKGIVFRWPTPMPVAGGICRWSPNGREISIGLYTKGYEGVWIAEPDKKSVRKLADAPATIVKWSRNRTRIALVMRQPVNETWILDLKPAMATVDALAKLQSNDSWIQLFNGKDLTGWDGDERIWTCRNDEIVGQTIWAAAKHQDFYLRSAKTFKDFELRFKARLGNTYGIAGVRVRGTAGVPIGPSKHLGKFYSKTYGIGKYLKSGKNHDRLKQSLKLDFNDFVLKCVGKHVTLSVNGITTIDEEFADIPLEGAVSFHVMGGPGLQNQVTFRDMMIRDLTPPSSLAWKQLFNGKNLRGWNAFSPEKGADANKAWTIDRGHLICNGKPFGYLHSTKTFSDYMLSFEWKAPKKLVGQNECLLYVHGQSPHQRLPKAIGINLFADGKVYVFVSGPKKLTKVHTVEAEPGAKPSDDWKKVDVICKGDAVEVRINGKARFNGAGFPLQKGFVALRSSGQTIQFRNLKLWPLTPVPAYLDLQWDDPALNVSMYRVDVPTQMLHRLKKGKNGPITPGRYNLDLDTSFFQNLVLKPGETKKLHLPETGILRIELDDPNIRVKVDGIELSGGWTEGKTHFHQHRMITGKHRVSASIGKNTKLYDRTISIEARKTQRIRVSKGDAK